MYLLLALGHLVGLALGVGAATVKLVLLFTCKSDPAFVSVYVRVAKLITRLIVLGLILLTLSGIGWMIVLGYSFTPTLIVKLIFVAVIWVLGPIIDNVIEPKFEQLAPLSGSLPSSAFMRIHQQYLALEVTATLLFYVILVLGALL